MDFSSSQKYIQTQTLLNTINGQFQNLSVQEPREKVNSGATPLSRSSSLLESLGMNNGSDNSNMYSPASPFNSFVPTTNTTDSFAHSSMLSKGLTPFQNDSNAQMNYSGLYTNEKVYEANTPMSSFQTLSSPVGKSNIAAETYGFVNSFIAQPLWKYIDVQGNVQGPFSSSDMTTWYQQGYFQPNLSIYRVNEGLFPNSSLAAFCNRFFTLSELVIQTQNSQDPFNTFEAMLNKPENPQPEIANPVPSHISNPLMKLTENQTSTKTGKIADKNVEVSLEHETTPVSDTQKLNVKNLPSLINGNGQKNESPKSVKSKKFVFRDNHNYETRSPTDYSVKAAGNQANESNKSKPSTGQKENSNKPAVVANPKESSWTSIAVKHVNAKTVLKNQTSKNTIDPVKLRSVSSTPVTKTIGTSQTNPKINTLNPVVPSTSKKEFLTWCKKNMKLNSGLSRANVIELLLSMPTDVESEIIVAETIYSSSDTMDGRRFAKEFIKRRSECENNNDPLDWNEAIKLFIGDNDDDWEFQVVSKKKKN